VTKNITNPKIADKNNAFFIIISLELQRQGKKSAGFISNESFVSRAMCKALAEAHRKRSTLNLHLFSFFLKRGHFVIENYRSFQIIIKF
jgi:hypothetical protein